MLNSAINYPYPLLRTTPVDYVKSTFNATINVTNEAKGYDISVNYVVDNEDIQKLIDEKKASFALEIQCISTWYRRLELSGTSEHKLFLSSSIVHERVVLCPCIVACEYIEDFYSTDFTEDFEGISTPINKGEVIAIGERKKFDALYKDDIIKKSESIISFKNDVRTSIMYCEWEYETIQIHLPSKQYEQYNQIGKYEPWKVCILNAIFIIPVIVEAINFLYQDECQGGDASLYGYAWYKTLKFLVGKIANNDVAIYKKLLADSIGTTQLLMNDNSSLALDLLSKVSKQ